jgi:hypothetical protein
MKLNGRQRRRLLQQTHRGRNEEIKEEDEAIEGGRR